MNPSEQAPGSLAELRHELYTPLNAMLGYSELAVETCQEQGLEGFIPDLQKIILACKRLLETLKAALDPGRIEALEARQPGAILDAELDFQLRTALNAILGYAELAIENAEDAGCYNLLPDLQKIHAAAGLFLDRIGSLQAIQPERDQPDSENETPNPAPEPPIRETVPQQSDETAPATDGKLAGNILIVDDNPMNRDTLARYLKKLGYTVEAAEDGAVALEMVERGRFDLVLLDIIMPVLNGYQVLERLKAEAAWRDIPVIMISGLDEIDSVVRCILMGAEDYLPKPFNQVLLNARICASLEKKRLRDQEVEYLRNVHQITNSAAAVEAGEFEPESLSDVARRQDELGQLARVFQSMAQVVFAREQQLKQQVQQLQIELDEARLARQVSEITESQYFQSLQSRAKELRQILDGR
jgi:DNA-binding response OmpR family regulator